MKNYLVFGIGAGLLALSAVSASAEILGADSIKRDIVGRTIYLAVPLGGEFPLNYRTSGVVDGSGKALGLGRFIKPEDTGKWWIEGDKLCQKFSTWYKGAPMCFTLTRTGPKTLKWVRNNGEVGTARIGD